MSEGKHIERVEYEGRLHAIIVRTTLPHDGMNFVSREEDTLQLGVNHYSAGVSIRRHVHLPVEKVVTRIQEVIHIDSGKVLLELYSDTRMRFHETQLAGGDTVILLQGGHGFQVVEDTRIVEVKQGPFEGTQQDKELF